MWIALALLALGGLAWALRPAPTPPAPRAEDSGMSPAQTEELMRSIGYVQQ